MANKKPQIHKENLATPFKKGESGNPLGKPTRLDTILAKQMTDEERKCRLVMHKQDPPSVALFLLGASESFLKRISKDKSVAMLVRIWAKGLLNDLETGEPNTTEKLIKLVCGNPKNIGEGADGSPVYIVPQPFSREEVLVYLKRIRERG